MSQVLFSIVKGKKRSYDVNPFRCLDWYCLHSWREKMNKTPSNTTIHQTRVQAQQRLWQWSHRLYRQWQIQQNRKLSCFQATHCYHYIFSSGCSFIPPVPPCLICLMLPPPQRVVATTVQHNNNNSLAPRTTMEIWWSQTQAYFLTRDCMHATYDQFRIDAHWKS